MIWVILAAIGVPLWLCAVGILTVIIQNRKLRKRYGDIPVRVRRPGKSRWRRGHAVWVSDVFAWRGSPAAWDEELLEVTAATLREPSTEERRKLRHLDDDPVIATLSPADDGPAVEVASAAAQRAALLGQFGPTEKAEPARA